MYLKKTAVYHSGAASTSAAASMPPEEPPSDDESAGEKDDGDEKDETLLEHIEREARRRWEFNQHQEFLRAQAFQEAQRAHMARMQEERHRAEEIEKARMEMEFMADLAHTEGAIRLYNKIKGMPQESPFVSEDRALKNDASLSDQDLEILAAKYDGAVVYPPGEDSIGILLAKDLRNCARRTVDKFNEHQEEDCQAMIEELRGDMIKVHRLFKLYALRDARWWQARYKVTKETLQNPGEKTERRFNFQAQTLLLYYKNCPDIIKKISSFSQCTVLPMQKDFHESIIDVVNSTEDLFKRHRIQPGQFNANLNAEYISLSVINYLSLARAVNLSSKFEEAGYLKGFCLALLSIGRIIGSIIDDHSSQFWNAWWFKKNFAQRLNSCIEQSSDAELNKVYAHIESASDKLAEVLKNVCERSSELKELFMRRGTEIRILNDQKNYPQAGRQAVDLITTILESVISVGQKTDIDMTSVNARLKQIVDHEQEYAKEVVKDGFKHCKLFNPNTIVFIDSILRVQKS
jgi:hypothetical protein